MPKASPNHTILNSGEPSRARSCWRNWGHFHLCFSGKMLRVYAVIPYPLLLDLIAQSLVLGFQFSGPLGSAGAIFVELGGCASPLHICWAWMLPPELSLSFPFHIFIVVYNFGSEQLCESGQCFPPFLAEAVEVLWLAQGIWSWLQTNHEERAF